MEQCTLSPAPRGIAWASTAVLAVALSALSGTPARAQEAEPATTPKLLYACYVPASGTTYRIKEADTKQECASERHVMFSWNEIGPQGP
ncbi:MAG TPA: hypothetical protein VG106_09000, partial [Vicinamibacterales bacterium]|nr:hypothetical protein [Vicinamibacterales bacterium]